MVYIKVEIGSRARGYDIESSDGDYVVFTKCTPWDFAKFWSNRQVFVNKHKKEKDGDYTYADLFFGLTGLQTGKYAYLIYATEEDVKDKNGVENKELWLLICKLKNMFWINIVRTMIRYKYNKVDVTPKKVLQLMSYCAIVDYSIRNKKLPENFKLPILIKEDEYAFSIFKSLMEKRKSNETTVDESEKLFVENWKEMLMNKLSHIPDPPERLDITVHIGLYMLNAASPMLPEDSNITNIIYPTITKIEPHISKLLRYNYVIVQEKLDGCNFRIIVTEDGEIVFGSRNTYRATEDFFGYHRIKNNLTNCANKLKNILNLTKGFIIYGELLGWKDDRKTPINKIIYRQLEVDIAFYAYDIQMCDGKNYFLDFILAQKLLEEAGFDTIPYQVVEYNNFINKVKFQSLLFPGHNSNEVEGYIIRYKNERYKLKEDNKYLPKIRAQEHELYNQQLIEEKLKETNNLNTLDDFVTFTTSVFNELDSNNERSHYARGFFNQTYNIWKKIIHFDKKDYGLAYERFQNNIVKV